MCTGGRQGIRDLKIKILRSMDIGVRGRHSTKRFAQRIGVRQPESVIRLLKKALLEGTIVSTALDNIHVVHNHRLFTLIIDFCPIDGVKKLYPKTVMLENTIDESPFFIDGDYKGKTIKKAHFGLCA